MSQHVSNVIGWLVLYESICLLRDLDNVQALLKSPHSPPILSIQFLSVSETVVSMSALPRSIASLASYTRRPAAHPEPEPAAVISTITALGLQKHPEGGYFVETDRDTTKIPNPFVQKISADAIVSGEQDSTRDTSTTIFYLLSPGSPFGTFHRNRARTIHTLHGGRGCYIVIHADDEAEGEAGTKARVEIFLVGHSLADGEKLQWVVEGGKFKASFLLPDHGQNQSSEGLLISETVTPGFEFSDHDFMTATQLNEMARTEQIQELSWLLRRSED